MPQKIIKMSSYSRFFFIYRKNSSEFIKRMNETTTARRDTSTNRNDLHTFCFLVAVNRGCGDEMPFKFIHMPICTDAACVPVCLCARIHTFKSLNEYVGVILVLRVAYEWLIMTSKSCSLMDSRIVFRPENSRCIQVVTAIINRIQNQRDFCIGCFCVERAGVGVVYVRNCRHADVRCLCALIWRSSSTSLF